MRSRIEDHGRNSGRRRQAVIGAFAVGTVLLSAAMAARAQQAPSYSVLYTFTGGTDGAIPNFYDRLALDKEGNLYGTTAAGGNLSECFGPGCGVVFRVDPAGNETVLHTFTGGVDGNTLFAGLIRDKEGNLYSTTPDGGNSQAGTVFKLDPTGKETVLYSFTGGTDGGGPQPGVVRDEKGNLYGTTFGGGDLSCAGGSGCGVVFKVDPAGNETVLHAFTPANDAVDGAQPTAGLVRDKEGNLYGTTTYGGGASAFGVVFKLDRTGNYTVLYRFTGGTGGLQPVADLVRDEEDNLYGTTPAGGDLSCAGGSGCGVVFKLDPTGKFTVLYAFTGPDGNQPNGSLLRDKRGNLYGTTLFGGSCPLLSIGCGVVFKLDPAGNETVLRSFTAAADGLLPFSGLVQDKEGNLYGTTGLGGNTSSSCVESSSGCGVVFKLTLGDSEDSAISH